MPCKNYSWNSFFAYTNIRRFDAKFDIGMKNKKTNLFILLNANWSAQHIVRVPKMTHHFPKMTQYSGQKIIFVFIQPNRETPSIFFFIFKSLYRCLMIVVAINDDDWIISWPCDFSTATFLLEKKVFMF